MADKENQEPSVRLTRSAAAKAKAAIVSEPSQTPAKRKRKPLAELPNLSNTRLNLNTPPAASKYRRTTRSKSRKEESSDVVRVVGQADADDPQRCPHYATDIYQYLLSMEVEPKRRPLPNFIETVQNEVKGSMREILVDWLVEVAEEYNLVADTLYLTISYVDRFLSAYALSKQKLQLLGVSAMLIASKYEEITAPKAEDFCYITDNTYTKQEVAKMEAAILKVLNFEIGNPTIKTFLRRFIYAAQEDGKYPKLKLEFLGNYIAELSLLDYACVGFLPSVAAASAVFLARFTINPNIHPWSSAMQHQTGYTLPELKDCIHALHDLQLNKKRSKLTVIREKYKQHKFKCVSTLLPPSEIPTPYFEGC